MGLLQGLIMKKRLLKDLPFSGLNSGAVLTKANGGYHVDNGDTIYETGGSSSNGWKTLEGTECDIVDMIWYNDGWFEPSTVKHLNILVSRNNISIQFLPLDLRQAQILAKGIQHCIVNHLKDGSYTWNEFSGFTTTIR